MSCIMSLCHMICHVTCVLKIFVIHHLCHRYVVRRICRTHTFLFYIFFFKKYLSYIICVIDMSYEIYVEHIRFCNEMSLRLYNKYLLYNRYVVWCICSKNKNFVIHYLCHRYVVWRIWASDYITNICCRIWGSFRI